MANTTIGVKLDETVRERIKDAAQAQGRSPHALIKQSILTSLDRFERGDVAPARSEARPFLAFARGIQPQSVLRARITNAYRQSEPDCVPLLIAEATLPKSLAETSRGTAKKLVEALRAKSKRGGVEGLVQEYSLSSFEGVALMCLAEALLRIPDRATRDALIRDKIAVGDWHSHVGNSSSVFVNAATWGLVVTGRLTTTNSETGLSSALTRLIARGGEPVIRKGVDLAMRMMGEQFVTGQTIGEALANSRKAEARGFRYSYDMLGEAAMTAADADRYYRDYEQAIHAIGKAANRRGIYEGPGISIKLSALHPRYARAQRERVMTELFGKLKALASLARHYDIGLNIDAEEADRLELSLDLLEALCFAPELQGWNGIGFVVQAYQKRAPFVLDFIIDLARRSGHRLMIRLVKGAYWDSEIKRAQVDGLEGFPVYTRKLYTDVSYLACAKKLLKAPDAVFPQFATHNAQTVGAIHAMAGENFYVGQYEFQCLHGMGEPLYDEVVGKERLNRPCRIYAPVGTHETLLAYLVRRLLENGANSSFVNRIADPNVKIKDLVADPVAAAAEMEEVGCPPPPHRPAPRHVRRRTLQLRRARPVERAAARLAFGRPAGGNERAAAGRAADRRVRAPQHRAGPAGAQPRRPRRHRRLGGRRNPGRYRPRLRRGSRVASSIWSATPPAERAAMPRPRRRPAWRHACPPCWARSCARPANPCPTPSPRCARPSTSCATTATRRKPSTPTRTVPLGPVVVHQPVEFPARDLFTGQVAAALAAGNTVLAKPAEETPLIAARAVAILREAGVPAGAVQLLPGAGEIGAALVGDARAAGVLFTGSTEVARLIQRQLAARLGPNGHTVPLIAETGGQNALIVDSSALAEQVVGDVIASAFDSAGQRCSALRVLCLQEEVADRVLAMLKGAMAELVIGNPDRLSVDVGPVISAEARQGILAHIEAKRAAGRVVDSLPLPEACEDGTFVAPTIIEITSLDDLEREVFGPVLHVLRYRRPDLDGLLDAINAKGYGLTFGLHTRIDETIAHVTARIGAGNLYVNRNVIGAVVGVQPFGGNGLSGTGPKAGGPLYLHRLLAERPAVAPLTPRGGSENTTALAFHAWLVATGRKADAERAATAMLRSLLGTRMELQGPVGERNNYGFKPRGRVFVSAQTETGVMAAVAAALATGNPATVSAAPAVAACLSELPPALRGVVSLAGEAEGDVALALFEGDGDGLLRLNQAMAARPGAIVPVYGVTREGLESGAETFPLEWMVEEVSVSTNTAAAGGNASLMNIG